MKTSSLFLAFAICVASHASAYDVVLMDNPAIRLQFDRKYEVFKVDKKDEPASSTRLAYMMLPADQQSAVSLFIGDGFESETEESIAKDHPGAKVTKVDCMIAQYKAQWWHYKDESHFYSDCLLSVPLPSGKTLPITISLVANTPKRLASLEDSFSKIMMTENPPNKAAEPTRTPGTPPADAGDRASGARGSP
jgi:hypothetical protein